MYVCSSADSCYFVLALHPVLHSHTLTYTYTYQCAAVAVSSAPEFHCPAIITQLLQKLSEFLLFNSQTKCNGYALNFIRICAIKSEMHGFKLSRTYINSHLHKCIVPPHSALLRSDMEETRAYFIMLLYEIEVQQ